MFRWSLQTLETGLQNCERFVNIVTPRLLIIGFVLSMVDLLTHGGLLNYAVMVWLWAIIQALAVDATLPEMWRRCASHIEKKEWWAGVGVGGIGVLLAIVVFYALAIQFLQQSAGQSLSGAMSMLDVNPATLAFVRAGSVVFLTAVLSVLNRSKQEFTAKPEQTTVNEEKTSPNRQVTRELHVVSPSKQQVIEHLLSDHPELGPTELGNLAGVSKGFASATKTKYLARMQQQQEIAN